MAFKRKKMLNYRQYQARVGWIFISPWIFGFLFFFLVPLVKSFYYSLCSIVPKEKGFEFIYKGFEEYKFMFLRDPNFIMSLSESFQNMIIDVPIIIFLSIFIATILSKEFRGNTLSRAIFFLPAVIGTGIILSIIQQDTFIELAMSGQTSYANRGVNLAETLIRSGVSQANVDYIMSVINRIFDLVWKMGIQIVLFLSMLKSIPDSFYEAAEIEGSTAWETFWKITFPTISPMILVCIVFTINDYFMDFNNKIMQMIIRITYTDGRYAYGSAMSWVYFVVVFIVLMIVIKFVNKYVIYTDQ